MLQHQIRFRVMSQFHKSSLHRSLMQFDYEFVLSTYEANRKPFLMSLVAVSWAHRVRVTPAPIASMMPYARKNERLATLRLASMNSVARSSIRGTCQLMKRSNADTRKRLRIIRSSSDVGRRRLRNSKRRRNSKKPINS